jgi:hypothetical protein
VKRLTGVWAALVLSLVLAATAGSALAENPHNPGTSPGNSGNAPGQEKKEENAAATTPAVTSTAQPAQAAQAKEAPGQEKKAEVSAGANSKKSAPAASSTSSTSAKASHTAADGSKQYGNGKSALEIAKQTKASITIDDLSEPGNSGRHKITICHNGHLITVDVHALNAHSVHLDGSDVIPATSASQCQATVSTPQGATQTQSVTCPSITTTRTTTEVQRGHAYGRLKHGKSLHSRTRTETEVTPTGEICNSSTGQGADVLTSITTIFGSPVGGSAAAGTAGTGGVAGGTAGSVLGTSAGGSGGVGGAGASLGSGKAQGGVLGVAAVRLRGTLPFTGFPLWIAVLIGAALLTGGVTLVRRSRALKPVA